MYVFLCEETYMAHCVLLKKPLHPKSNSLMRSLCSAPDAIMTVSVNVMATMIVLAVTVWCGLDGGGGGRAGGSRLPGERGGA